MSHARAILLDHPALTTRETGIRMNDQAHAHQSYDLEWHLRNWARWMQAQELPDGCPTEASGGILQNFSSSPDWDTVYEKNDAWCALNTDAAVRALAPSERAAIDHRYLESVWRFPRNNFEELLEAARMRVRATLIRRGVWVGD